MADFSCIARGFKIYLPIVNSNIYYEYLSKQAGGVSMSFEAISVITQAEETAKQGHAQAVADAKAAQSAAEVAGKAAVEAAAAKARQEVHDKQVQTDAKAVAAAEALAGETKKQVAAMRQSAEGRLEKAASLIVERIVNG